MRLGRRALRAFVGAASVGAASASATSQTAGAAPVVLELFTSQGCSSCPPADEVLSRLGSDPKTAPTVIPLAFHVDYWNRVGWTDPFGKAQWSARQEAYNRVFGLPGGYTPQLVVNGHAQLNGSHEDRALREIATELERSSPVRIQVEPQVGGSARRELSVVVSAEIVEDLPSRKLEAFLALFENGLVTPVSKGENGGRTLRNDFVVRRFEKALSIQTMAGTRAKRTLTLELDSAWKLDDLGVAAFLQDPKTMTIVGATVRALRSGPQR